MSRKKERKEDELPAVNEPFLRLSADHMYHQRAREGNLVHYVSFTIRDEYSGCGMAYLRKTRSQDQNRLDLKRFAGHIGKGRPEILVKSDAASEITKAVDDLGWLSEPSLENTTPFMKGGLAR